LATISNKFTYLLCVGRLSRGLPNIKPHPHPELDTPSIKSQKHAALLSPKCAKSRRISRKFERIAVQGHPRSTILTLNARKQLVLPTAPMFDAPGRGNSSEFLDGN